MKLNINGIAEARITHNKLMEILDREVKNEETEKPMKLRDFFETDREAETAAWEIAKHVCKFAMVSLKLDNTNESAVVSRISD